MTRTRTNSQEVNRDGASASASDHREGNVAGTVEKQPEPQIPSPSKSSSSHPNPDENSTLETKTKYELKIGNLSSIFDRKSLISCFVSKGAVHVEALHPASGPEVNDGWASVTVIPETRRQKRKLDNVAERLKEGGENAFLLSCLKVNVDDS